MNSFPRSLLFVLTLAILGLLGVGTWFYRTQEQGMRQSAEANLQAIADLKVSQITGWRNNQLGEGDELVASPFFREGTIRWLAKPQDADIQSLLSEFRSRQTHFNYRDVLLTAPDGNVLLSLSGQSSQVHPEVAVALSIALRDQKTMLTELHAGAERDPCLAVIAPIFAGNGPATKPVGAVVMISDAGHFLYPLIQSWPSPSKSAETLLVRRDGDSVLFLNELRHQTNTRLKLRIPLTETNVPAVMAVLGHEGVVHGMDYRGVEVISVLKPIPGSSWYMVAKADAAEILATWRTRSLLLLTLMGTLVALFSTFVVVLWQRNQKGHYRELYQAEATRRTDTERHRTTLKSIGDAVITTDGQGRVELLNPVAELLTGWTHEEARGQRLEDVFRIINEESRQTVESPVQQVLRKGAVVGLANHTLLLARDGTEHPIADSGAPIRNDRGEIIGVVLVFRDQTEERAVQEALRQREAHFRLLYEQSPVGYQSLDAEGRLLEVNPAWLQLLGYTREEVIGRWFGDFLTPGQSGLFRERFPKFKAQGEVHGVEFDFVRKDGVTVSTSIDGLIARDAAGAFKQTHCILHNITERKRTEDALRESEERFRRIFEDGPMGIAMANMTDGRLLRVNKALCELLGYTEAELQQLTFVDLTHTDYRDQDVNAVRRMRTGEIQKHYTEKQYLKKNGEAIWGARALTMIHSADGKSVYALAMIEDITERKQAEEALRENEHLLSESQRIAHIGSWIYSFGDQITWSEETFRIYGVSAETFTPTVESLLNLIHPEDRAAMQKWIAACMADEQPGELEFRFIRPDGTPRIACGRGEVHVDANGTPVWMAGTVQDITERKQAESALLREQGLFKDLVNTLPVGMYRLRLKPAREWNAANLDERLELLTTVEMVSDRFCEITGLSREEFSTDASIVTERVHPDDRSGFVLKNVEAAESGTPFSWEGRVIVTAHQTAWLHFESVPRQLEDGGVIWTGIVQDITERKRAEERLLQQATLLDAASDAIYIRTMDHTVTYWNEGAERLYGWTRDEAMGQIIPNLAGVDSEAFEAAQTALLEQGGWSGELTKVTRAGKEFVVFCRWTLLRDEQGRPAEVLAINTDITEKKYLENQFLRAQRMEAIGLLAGGIAHDLNNILTPILMSSAMLRETITDAEDLTMIETVETSAQRGADILKQLLTFARGKPGARLPLPLRHLLREMEKFIHETFPRNLQLSVNTPADLWPVLGDATQIHQALMNLCVNARDAMPDGGTLSLSAENATLDEAGAAMSPDTRPGDYVCVRVTDTGTGISPGHIDRIFDPFFTTKEIGKGTGLGLATVLGIVRGHGGFVRVNSQIERGTTFELHLPASRQAKSAGPVPDEPPAPHGHGELILVVDDEASMRRAVQQTLEKHGYRVLTANEGSEALELHARHRAEIRVIITDMMMPGMDGPKLIQALRQEDAHLPIIGMTGLAEQAGVKGLEALDLAVLLSKPFSAAKLHSTLHHVLGSAGERTPAA